VIERRWIKRINDAADGLAIDLGLYALSTVFAFATATSSTLAPHRTWGHLATFGYAAATLCVLGQLIVRRGRAALTALTWAATALVPLAVEAARGQAQEEVIVVERAGQRLLDTGTPYLSREAIAALPADERLLGYVSYQPGMALFGLPRAIASSAWWTDARVFFALVTAAALVAALVVVRDRADGAALVRAAQAVTVLPICALTLAVGGDDMPVLALCLLALACAARGWFGRGGLAVGAAGALKLFAWPVALVLLAYAATRGRRALTSYAAPALGLPVLVVLPPLLVHPAAAIENLVRFPLGKGLVASPAASPFPGHLIASAVPGGRAIAAALLVATGLVIGWWLLRRPPRDAAAAALICAYGLTAAILLMPSTRFGYLLYPIAYLVWRPVLVPTAKGSRTVAVGRTQGE
jgi:hypothetical protein